MDRRSLRNKSARSFHFTNGWRCRGYLPHLDRSGVQQFVTIRLADALPASVYPVLRQEVARLAARLEKGWGSREEILQRVLRLERLLDSGFGSCVLQRDDVGSMVAQAIVQLEEMEHRVYAWVVMPNHVHLLIRTGAGMTLSRVIRSFKGFTANQAHKILGSRGVFWYPEHFDRYIRDDEHFRKVVDYIGMNPVKAGLVRSPQEWKLGSVGYGGGGAM